MKQHRQQSGVTLVVSLIMLAVLTLLVASAIRFGNINLKISGNAQTEVEASAATQVAIERMVEEVVASEKLDAIAAQPEMVVSTGGATYKANVSKPVCGFSKNVVYTQLNPSIEADRACFEGGDPGELIFDKDGAPVPKPTACKDQNWDIAATVADAGSGAQVSMLQGVSVRVGVEVKCP